MVIDRKRIQLIRYGNHETQYPEIKDPSLVAVGNKWMMYASIGTSVTQKWTIGRFEANSLEGPWYELPPAIVHGLNGPQICAPAVTYGEKDGRPHWRMYVQTACFEENGVIACIGSQDGMIFNGVSATLIRSDMLAPQKQKVVGLYDAGVSDVTWNNETITTMVFSGYRSVGNGDLYLSYKKKDDHDMGWSAPTLIMTQEEVPFHNKPGSEDYEWGLEGAKIVQLSPTCFLMIAVCFAPLPKTYIGHRQRVFLSASHSPFGPYSPIGVPFMPMSSSLRFGEQGHPDTVIIDNTLWIVYQERKNQNSPWYLCYAKLSLPEFLLKIQSRLSAGAQKEIVPSSYERFYFDMPRM